MLEIQKQIKLPEITNFKQIKTYLYDLAIFLGIEVNRQHGDIKYPGLNTEFKFLIKHLDQQKKEGLIDDIDYRRKVQIWFEERQAEKEVSTVFNGLEDKHFNFLNKCPFLATNSKAVEILKSNNALDENGNPRANTVQLIINTCFDYRDEVCLLLDQIDTSSFESEDKEFWNFVKENMENFLFPSKSAQPNDIKIIKSLLAKSNNNVRSLDINEVYEDIKKLSSGYYSFFVKEIFGFNYQMDEKISDSVISYIREPLETQIETKNLLNSGNKAIDELPLSDLEKKEAKNDLQTLVEEFYQMKLDFNSTSAEPFVLINKKSGQRRNIPSFKDTLSKKIVEYFVKSIYYSKEYGDLNLSRVLEQAIKDIILAEQIYQKTVDEIIPCLERVNAYLDSSASKGVIFSGRDGIAMYMAYKASNFGKDFGLKLNYKEIFEEKLIKDPEKKLEYAKIALGLKNTATLQEFEKLYSEKFNKILGDAEFISLAKEGLDIVLQGEAKFYNFAVFVNISRLTIENGNAKLVYAEYLEKYLRKIIGYNLAIDSAGHGSVLTAMLKYAGVNEADLIDRMLLVHSTDKNVIKQLPGSSRSDGDNLELIPKHDDRSVAIMKNGGVLNQPNTPQSQLLSWVTNQAITRHFLPKE